MSAEIKGIYVALCLQRCFETPNSSSLGKQHQGLQSLSKAMGEMHRGL